MASFRAAGGQATAALTFARETLADKGDARSDYEHNLFVACSQSAIDGRLLGIACSLISMHLREVERRSAPRSASAHVGAKGDKLGLRLTLLRVSPIDGDYGVSYLHKFSDASGNLYSWFSTKKLLSTPAGDAELVEGQEYSVWGTVKGHSEFRGQKETQLTRCVVTSPELMDAEKARLAAKAVRAAAKAAKLATVEAVS